MNTNSPIELLLALGVNDARTKKNIDDSLSQLKKYYDRNPLLINVDFDKNKALKNLNSMLSGLKGQSVDVDVNFKQNGNGLNQISNATKDLKDDLGELESLMNSVGKKSGGRKGNDSSAFFDLDVDRVITQLDNLGRRGQVAQSQIDAFTGALVRLKGTGDRLALKTITTSLFDVSSSATHADKVVNGLEKSLSEMAKLQNQLTGLKEKFSLNPSTSSEYQRLNTLVNSLTSNIFKLQNEAYEGGTDKIKLAQQMREVQTRIKEAKYELDQFNTSSNKEASFEKTVSQAQKLYNELQKIGTVSDTRLDSFANAINGIGNSSLSTQEKITHLNRAMDSLKDHNKNLKFDIKFDEGIDNADRALRKLEDRLDRLGKVYKKDIDKSGVDALKQDFSNSRSRLANVSNPEELRQYNRHLRDMQRAMQDFSNATMDAARASKTWGEYLNTAFKKFPVWMLSATLFYAPIRGMQDLIEKTIELDTAMTNLRRVMDLPDYKFNEIIEKSIDNIGILAGKTSDYLELVSEFGRTGKNDQESLALANTATILQNISDLNAKETMDALTAAQISYNIAAEDSITIANKLNEVDNNYSITTKDLAIAMQKSASTAKTFGVELDTLLGYTTAIGSATRETGSVVGNSLKSIFARITTNDSALNALSAIGISINDISGNVKSASTIIDEIAGKWNTLSDAQRQNTAVGVAGIYQLSRFNALMLNYGTAQDAATTAANSQNSAMNEQEKYAKSLEARINRLNTAWYDFVNTASEAVVYDGIVVVTELLKTLTGGAEGAVSSIGLLAPVFGLAGVAAYTLSSSLRGMIATQYQLAVAQTATTGATGLMAGAMTVAGTAVRALTFAMRGLLIASGVGVVIAGLGFALEKLIGVWSDGIQAQEEFDLYNRKNTEALTTNKDAVTDLISEYTRLTNAKENGNTWDSTKEEEYLKIQQKLGELYPALISYTDSSGQMHLKSAEAIQKEVQATQDLVAEQNKLTLEKAISEFDKLNETISGGLFSSFDNFLKGSLQSRIKQHKALIESREMKGLDTSQLKVELAQMEREVQNASDKIKSHMLEVANAIDEVDIDPGIQKTLESFLRSLDFSNMDSSQLKAFAEEFGKLQTEMQKAMKAGDEDAFNKVVKSLNELAKQTNDSKFKEFTTDFEKMTKAVKNGETVFVDTENAAEGMGDAVSEALYKVKDASEAMAGVTQEQIDDTAELLWQYEMYTNQMRGYTEEQINAMVATGNLTSEQKALVAALEGRTGVMDQLNQIYPSLLDKDGKAIELTEEKIAAIKQEQIANETLLKAYKLSKDGKLSAEQNMTLASASATKERINNIKTEIQALTILQKALQETYNKQAKAMDEMSLEEVEAKYGKDSAQYREYGKGAYDASKILGRVNFQISDHTSELDRLQASLNGNIGTIGSFVSEIEDADKAGKKNNKTTKESIYLQDKYKRSLELVNLEIAKQQKLRESEPEWSNKYLKSLQAELVLQKQKLALQQSQSKEMEKQIKSGKIQQTGLVETGKTSSKSVNLSGWGAITSDFGMRYHPILKYNKMHEGIDLASKLGTRLDANVSGKVISQGYNNTSGNYVKIEDSQGFKHFYAHLDKAFVKLGDMVEAGQQIGNIGSTGNSTGAHLHYQVWDSLNKLIDPKNFVNAAKSGTTVTTSNGKSASTTAAEAAQAVDQTQSDLIALEQSILDQLGTIKELEQKIRQTVFAAFENRRSQIDSQLSYEDSKLKNVDKSSARYNKTIDYQTQLLTKKQTVNKEEMAYLDELISKGGLPADEMAEYKARVVELRAEMQSLNTTIQEVINSQLALYDTDREFIDNGIDYYNTLLESLDTNSNAYLRTLNDITSGMKDKQKANEAELAFLDRNIRSGKFSGEVLEGLKNRYEDLVTSIQKLSQELKKMNYDIVLNIKVRVDEKIDDLDFQLRRSELIQGMYESGTADYNSEVNYQISKLQEMEKLQKQMIENIKKEMKNVDLLPEDVKQLNELLEDSTLKLFEYQSQILNLKKSMDESLKKQQEDLANKLINSYKDYLNEMKDAKAKSIQDEIDLENKRHNQVMKNLSDEQDRFRKAIEEKRQLLDRQEAERSYSMEIDDLEKQRNKIQDDINLLSLDDSHAAKAKKKKLEEDLAKIEKDIAEKRHQRDLELQKQGLDDLLDLKDAEIQEKEELENSYHEGEIKRLDDLKKYWEQYYTDMLNNERKFAEIRKQILSGDFEALRNEFGDYLNWLESTMPDLENTLNGTMSAVGTSIRQNIIDNLREALSLMNQVANPPSASGSHGSSGGFDSAGDNFTNPSPTEPPPSNNKAPVSGYKNLSNADMQVLLAKFIREKIAPVAPAGKERDSVKYKGDVLAAQGRSAGSQISPNESLSQALAKLDSDGLESLSNFTTYNFGGINSSNYIQMIKKWSNQLRRDASSGIASLNGGGLLNFKGKGIDGIGGRLIIGHDGEVMQTPLEVDKMLNMTMALERALGIISPTLAKPPTLSELNNQSTGGFRDVIIQMDGAIIQNSNRRDAVDFVNDVANEMKTKGMW